MPGSGPQPNDWTATGARPGWPNNAAGKVAHEVRCPYCHALQFIAAAAFAPTSVAEAVLVIKCWRRTCKRILPLRIVTWP